MSQFEDSDAERKNYFLLSLFVLVVLQWIG